jgi:glycosyltransferase involved in cell wall biosynthesis
MKGCRGGPAIDRGISHLLVSVALPNFNGMPYLKEALPSILTQDLDFELIVSDDSSDDDSLDYLHSVVDPRLKVLSNDTNKGTYGNVNRCISAALGEFIQVFCSDDVMKPGYLESQLRLLRKYPEAGLAYASPEYINEKSMLIPMDSHDDTPEVISAGLYAWISSHFLALPASISSIMVPKRTVEAIGLFDESFRRAGDLEFYNRVSERYPIVRNTQILHSVRRHSMMTGMLPTSGPIHLAEELTLEEWYRQRWSKDEYRKIKRFRSAIRGRYHLGWIGRTALRGALAEAAIAIWRMNKMYPLGWVLWWRLLAALPNHSLPTPSVAIPNGFPASRL